MATTKTIPIMRPECVLLLQPWSTATSQTANSRMALVAAIFSHMTCRSYSVNQPAIGMRLFESTPVTFGGDKNGAPDGPATFRRRCAQAPAGGGGAQQSACRGNGRSQ